MKKILPLLLCLCLCGCKGISPNQNGRLQIVASLFPQYDFAREICGDKADITLLLPAGMDSHSYEPTPRDIVTLSEASLFLYTGENMEPWAARLSENVKGQILDVSKGVTLLDGGNIHHAKTQESASASTDPHIWTNPQNAIIMVDNICAAVCSLDPDNAAFYTENANRYKNELSALDAEFESVVKNGKRTKLIFGGHFAMRYFTHRYGLTYESAFDSCAGEAEPSAQTVMHLIEHIREEQIPAVYYEELSTPQTAKLLADETGTQMLLLHSCHNISKEEQNETYLSLMKKNLENLKIGLN